MGCYLLWCIEQKNEDQNWYCVWHQETQFTAWNEKLRHQSNKPLATIQTQHNTLLHSALSGKSCGPETNALAHYNIGDKTGLFAPGLPQNPSQLIKQQNEQGFYQNYAHQSLKKLLHYERKITKQNWTKHTDNAKHQGKAVQAWTKTIVNLQKQFCAPNGSIKKVIGQQPDKANFENPDYDFTPLNSAHATLRNQTGHLWRTMKTGPQNIRIVLFYDIFPDI